MLVPMGLDNFSDERAVSGCATDACANTAGDASYGCMAAAITLPHKV